MDLQTPGRQALTHFQEAGGVLRTSQALELGIHPRTLYQLRDEGRLECLSRGVYRLADLPFSGDPDLVIIAARVPRAVICLISALNLHGITTEIPHRVSFALPPATKRPEITNPPIQVSWFSGQAYSAGIEVHLMDGVPVRVYNAPKTVADCFKFRNRLGVDVAVEALRSGLEEGLVVPAELFRYAQICRVERVLEPYLAAIL
jgi:predicted transcriptional regulator of viral defense system